MTDDYVLDANCTKCKGRGIVQGRNLRFVPCPDCKTGSKPKKNKYSAVLTEANGHKFASKREEKRYQALNLMLQAGIIVDLELHPSWLLQNDDITIAYQSGQIARYTADFRYFEAGEEIIEDVKSKATKTEAANLRIAVFESIYQKQVRIIL